MVQEVELVGHLGGARLVPGHEQLERRVGAPQAARRVQSRAEPEADGALVHVARLERRDAHQRPQPWTLGAGQGLQPLARQPAVLAAKRHEVAHGRETHEVALPLRRRRVAPGACPQRLGELVRHAGGAQAGERVGLERGVQDRACGQAIARAVVVGDDHVDAGRPRRVDLAGGGDPAVDGDQQTGPLRREPRHGGLREAVALEPRGQVPGGVPADRAQRLDDDRRRGHPVDVVVAVDHDSGAAPDVRDDQVARRRPCRA